jgi:hypothetical protein
VGGVGAKGFLGNVEPVGYFLFEDSLAQKYWRALLTWSQFFPFPERGIAGLAKPANEPHYIGGHRSASAASFAKGMRQSCVRQALVQIRRLHTPIDRRFKRNTPFKAEHPVVNGVAPPWIKVVLERRG